MYAHNEAQPRFTEEKTSCFFSIMKQVFEDTTKTFFWNTRYISN
jgi:hypothetical protein